MIGQTSDRIPGPQPNAYGIEFFDPAGGLALTVDREYESLERTSAQTERARNRLLAYARHYPSGAKDIHIEDTEPAILSMLTMSNGNLWVLCSRAHQDNPAESGLIYEVFDPEGRFLEQVALDCPIDVDRDLLFHVDEDRLVVVSWGVAAALAVEGVTSPENGVGPLEIICYQIGDLRSAHR